MESVILTHYSLAAVGMDTIRFPQIYSCPEFILANAPTFHVHLQKNLIGTL